MQLNTKLLAGCALSVMLAFAPTALMAQDGDAGTTAQMPTQQDQQMQSGDGATSGAADQPQVTTDQPSEDSAAETVARTDPDSASSADTGTTETSQSGSSDTGAADTARDQTTGAPTPDAGSADEDTASAPVESDQAGDQTAASPSDSATSSVATESKETFISEQEQEQILARGSLIGKSVMNPQDEKLGDVKDVLVDESGKMKAVIIGVGGFLGMGQKEVALSFNEIQTTTDDSGQPQLMLNATREELESAPDFASLSDQQSEQSDDSAAMGSGVSTEQTGDVAATGGTTATGGTADTAGTTATTGAGSEHAKTEAGSTPGEVQSQAKSDAEPSADMTDADQTADASGTATSSEGTSVATASGERFISAQQQGEILVNESLIGQAVENAEGEDLGDINDVLFNQDGQMTAVIIGMGGFLGLGTKNVAVSYDSIRSSVDESGEVQLVMNASREELEAAPQFVSLEDKRAEQERLAAQQQTGQPGTAQAPAGGGMN